MAEEISIGALSERTGVAPSALRFYEDRGLISSERTAGNQRRYQRGIVRRVSFIRAAQELGLSLDEISQALARLPDGRTPTDADWAELASSWAPRIDEQIQRLQRLRDRLDGCIGCGCLSMSHCRIFNPDDTLGSRGPGPRLVIDDT